MLNAEEIKKKYACEDSDVPEVLAVQQKGYDHGLVNATFGEEDFYDEVGADCVQLEGLLATSEDAILHLYKRAFREGRAAAKTAKPAAAPKAEAKPKPAEEPKGPAKRTAAPKAPESAVRRRRQPKPAADKAAQATAAPLESLADMMSRGTSALRERVQGAVGELTVDRIVGLPIIDIGSPS